MGKLSVAFISAMCSASAVLGALILALCIQCIGGEFPAQEFMVVAGVFLIGTLALWVFFMILKGVIK